MKYPKLQTIYLIVASALFFVSCYPDEPDNISELDIVGTTFDPEYDFSEIETYFLPDSVVHIEDLTRSSNNVNITRDIDDVILETVKENLDALGYMELETEDTSQVDVVIQVSAFSTTNTSIFDPYDWWGYWGWYPGWGGYPGYGPGWGYFYPWGPPIIYSYSTGTVLIEMVDPNNPMTNDEEVPLVWLAAINGLLSSNPGSNQNRVVNAINQAFEQSPYLND
ncbi:DUF4136 domain-containing protein [Sediminitomix flava]|uniref:Uncharacterized protein DUF4136 n=1 Tax=Sediminitomix flava TaxID=379075 RepID=A0A315YWF6_SEDFL|nr:DUF4136 domain-containing protein [Sediminitomix flava]PWJ34189.1 uncharacterized protein DUF4136 [Sediminitomix flava]